MACFIFFNQGEHLHSVFLFIQTVQLGRDTCIQGERVEDTLHKTVLIGFNPLPARGLSDQKLPHRPLFPPLLVVHQINFCVTHTKFSHIAKRNQDISNCNASVLGCTRVHLTIQAALQSVSLSICFLSCCSALLLSPLCRQHWHPAQSIPERCSGGPGK